MTVLAEPAARPVVVPAVRPRFYLHMAAACLAVAVIGFAPTYWIPLFRGTLVATPLTHAHAALFYGWTLLFLAQAWFAGTRKLARHREFGVFGVAMATAMCFVGVAAAIASLKRGEAAGFVEASRAFAIVPVLGISFFAVLFTIALINVKALETHRRLMVVATVSLLHAAVGRWFMLFLAPDTVAGVPTGPPPVIATVMPGLATDLLIVWAMVHDKRTRGRVHPVYWIAGGALVALQILFVPLSGTSAWMNVAAWLGTLSL